MIAILAGKIAARTPTASVIDCGGVGYEVFHTPFTAEKLSSLETCKLLIQTIVREDSFSLFGFLDEEERSLFRELLKVSGIGPKLALGILSGIPAHELARALGAKDATRLQKIPGVGKKTAERLVVELGDKLKDLALSSTGPTLPAHSRLSELESVLLNLGYQRAEIQRAMRKASERPDWEELSLEVLVKSTLTVLTGPRVS